MLCEIDSRTVKMNSTGRGVGGSVVGLERECTRLAEVVYDTVSYETHLVTGLVGQV